MGRRLQIDRISTKETVSRTAALRRIAVGFVLGCALLGLMWGAKGVARSADQPAQPKPVVTAPASQPEPLPEAKREWSGSSTKKMALPVSTIDPLQVGSVLVVVIVLAVGLVFLLKRVLKRARLAPGKRRVLELVDALPIGPKRFVYVLNLEGRTLVVGAGGDQVNLLAEYGEDEGPDPRQEEAAEDKPVDARLSRAVMAYEQGLASANAKDSSPEELPAGSHRVPAGFRHLLRKALDQQGEA